MQTLANIAGMTAELIESGKLVRVVRCKDCKHFKGGKCWNVMRRYGLHDGFFCADGKAKDGTLDCFKEVTEG